MKLLTFQVRRDATESLTEQVVRGIQAAAHTGQLTPEERLPTLATMAVELGVSIITMRRALAQLVAAGVLEARRGTGIRVRATHASRFQAHVLLITPVSPSSYYYGTRNHAFLEVLRRRAVHTTAVYIGGREMGARLRTGLRTVQHILDTQPVTLVALDGAWLGSDATLQRLLVERGIRFIETWSRQPTPAAADSVFLDVAPAYRQLARYGARCGVKEVTMFSQLDEAWRSFRDGARAAGLRVKHHLIRGEVMSENGEIGVERAGYSTLATWLKQGRIERGRSLLVSADDYFSRGALTALAGAGWQIPRDIQFVTLVNIGHVPVAGAPLTRIEMYPVRDGEAMATVVLRNLEPHQRRPKPLVMRSRFVAGKSTRPVGRARPVNR